MIRTLQGPQSNRILLDGKAVINLSANNYLGLANHPALISAAKQALDQYGLGPGAGRTIAGNFPPHNELEETMAQFKGVEAVIAFNSGLTANLAAIPALVGKGDVICSDALNHASIIDGCRLSRAEIRVYRHLDMESLEEQLRIPTDGKKLIVTDGVFSMDGDIAPLPDMVRLAKRYGAMLMVDDAHGDGVMGPGGKGTVEYYGLREEIEVETGSLSKAFGSVGGFVAGHGEFIETLRRRARTFIFTSSPLPVCMAAAATEAIKLLQEDDSRLQALWANREYFVQSLAKYGFRVGGCKTPIVPVYVQEESVAEQMTQMLYDENVFAQSVQYPVVAKGQARLRVILSALHTRQDLEEAAFAFEKVGRVLGVISS